MKVVQSVIRLLHDRTKFNFQLSHLSYDLLPAEFLQPAPWGNNRQSNIVISVAEVDMVEPVESLRGSVSVSNVVLSKTWEKLTGLQENCAGIFHILVYRQMRPPG